MTSSPHAAAPDPLQEIFAGLSRFPDVQAENLFAVDAADRLLLQTGSELLNQGGEPWPETITVIGDRYGALSLGALALGAQRIHVHTDALTARRAIENNLATLAGHWADRVRFLALDEVARDARLVLMNLPRGLDVLAEQAAAIAAVADPAVRVLAGGRIKHMNHSMNQVLAEHFGTLDVSLARQKSRVLTATGVRPDRPAVDFPVRATHQVNGTSFILIAGAATFGNARLDPGTALLLEHLPSLAAHTELIDLACGNGSIGIYAALTHPQLRVNASDHSASAVASTLAAADANKLSNRLRAVQDDGLSRMPSASASLITLNPPFHIGNTVTAQIAMKLIDEAARVLTEGGELICVFNSHLKYRSELARRIGPTEQLARNRTFTLTRSTRRSTG
ncbi:class I SAM-dependent methyltransferase [Glutamicibacter sp. NPDC087344]|uniref:class I SAM-dependent methyltransferase n=1 Tax=Glutamicibacter sp. NPDC087344 TaxID=3363994 RepID=UPI003829CD1C